MKRILFYYFLIIILLFGQTFGQKQKKKINIPKSMVESSFGVLNGQVWLGSPSEYAPKVTILILGNGIKKEIVSGNGGYTTNLPEGIYTISTSETFNNYAFKRAKFQIKAKQTTSLNIDPTLKISEIITHIDNNGFRDEYIKAPKPYFTRLKPGNDRSGLDLQIRYFRKKINGKVTEFKQALVTYDALSIYGDNITIDKNIKIVAEGQNVIVENNGKRSRATSVSLEIKNGKPLIQVANRAIIGIKGNTKFENGLVDLKIEALQNKLDKTATNFDNTLKFQDKKNNVNFVSNYYQIIINTDNEIVLEGTGCIRNNKTGEKCEPAGFTATIKDHQERSLESEFLIKINSIYSYSFKYELINGSIGILRN